MRHGCLIVKANGEIGKPQQSSDKQGRYSVRAIFKNIEERKQEENRRKKKVNSYYG